MAKYSGKKNVSEETREEALQDRRGHAAPRTDEGADQADCARASSAA